MGFQAVSFLSCHAGFCTTCVANCGKGLWRRCCHITVPLVVEGKYGHALCRMLFLQLIPFFVSVQFHGDHKIVTKLRRVLPPSVFWDITGLKMAVSVFM